MDDGTAAKGGQKRTNGLERAVPVKKSANSEFPLILVVFHMVHVQRNADLIKNRVRSMSVETPRSSASKTANPSPCSSSARTLVVLPGLSFTVASTARVSPRYEPTHPPSRRSSFRKHTG